MRFHSIICFLLFVVLSAPVASGQNFKEFSQESAVFFKQLNIFFEKVNRKEDQKVCEEMMAQVTNAWNSGLFTKEDKQNIIYVCNQMLKRRLKPYPDFYHYLSSNLSMVLMDHTAESYQAWLTSVDNLVNDKRSTKPIRTYLEMSHTLLEENILYKSRATSWRSTTSDFKFGYDTVPYVRFDSLSLVCRAYEDSSVIYNTIGVFYPIENRWMGKKGKVDWKRAGYDDETVYALLDQYEIYLGFSRYSADSVKFFHKDYWDKPLFGSLEEKVLANVEEEKASYPRFTTYIAQVDIKSVFKDMDYRGGIEIRGRKLIGIGVDNQNASLTIKRDGKVFIRIMSDNYIIYPDRIVSGFASATLYHREDSIFHPGLKINYIDNNRELSLVRAGDGNVKSPYYDSFHNLDIYSEAIYWKMDEPLMSFETVKGASGIGRATFESSSYFSEPRYLRLQGIDPVNPLINIKRYADKYNVSEVTVNGLSQELMLPPDQIIAMLVNLSNKGFVIYEREQKKARIKDKLYDYIDAVNKKIDYDVIQFNSETYGYRNAELELDSFNMKLYGVPLVFLSDSQQVLIYPSQGQLILKEDMNFNFAGRVHAGTFDFHARNVNFDYDQFKLDMPVIDSMSFTVPSFEKDAMGFRTQKKVRNVISDLGGNLYIDDPNNKSGLKSFPQYPIFSSTKDAYVYYDDPSIFGGVYDREKFYFYVYPFTIDSLDNFKTELLEFPGYLASAGIFPDIEDTLRVQRDYSLGFETTTPEYGFETYGGKGTYYKDIRLSNEGLRGKGTLKYITSTSWSDDYRFFPDSMNTLADKFIVEETFEPPEFPAVDVVNVWQHWVPYEDYMTLKYTEVPFNMFNGQSELLGQLVLTPEQLRGAGLMSFEDAEMTSRLYTFKQSDIFADSADFNLKSAEYSQSAFATKNYKSHIDFNQRMGTFTSNGGASYVEFPVNLYICLIDEFDWYMDSYEIAIGSVEKEVEMARYDQLSIRELIDIPLQGSEFISIHPEQDSLRFISTTATYNLRDYTLYAEDVKYIRVADAAIFPADRRITILPEAKMKTISDAHILINTVTRYHEIYDAVVDVKAARDYIGIGNYDYVDENRTRQQVFLREIKVDPTYQTIGSGMVSDTMGFKLSSDFYFTGKVNLLANNEHLTFDGGFKIRETCNRDIMEWIGFNSEVNPKEIFLNIDEDLRTIKQEKIESSILFSNSNNLFYSGFLNAKKTPSDPEIFSAHGFIRYDKGNDEFDIASLEKLKGQTLEGNQLSMSRRQCILTGQGNINLGADLGRVKAETYGTVNYYMIPDSAGFEVVMLTDFPFDATALEMMSGEIAEKNLKGVNNTRSIYKKALIDILGEEDAEKVLGDQSLLGRIGKYPKELEKAIVFSDLKLKWNYPTRSYISYGQLGIGSIGEVQVNKYVKGYVEIARKRTGDVLNIYLEFDDGRNWYFFNYRNNLLQTISSNAEYNTYIREMKDDKRTVKKDKDGPEYSFIISNLRKKTDFLRRIRQ
jgi:hypothetical protein